MPYLAIFLFAIIEGEIYYSAMCARAITGDLNWFAVLVDRRIRRRGRRSALVLRASRTNPLARSFSPSGRLPKHRERTCSFPRDRHRARQPLLAGPANRYPDCLRLRRNASSQVQRTPSGELVRLGCRHHAAGQGRRQHTGCPRRAVVVGAVHSGRFGRDLLPLAGAATSPETGTVTQEIGR